VRCTLLTGGTGGGATDDDCGAAEKVGGTEAMR
jgi:hypothetical protein